MAFTALSHTTSVPYLLSYRDWEGAYHYKNGNFYAVKVGDLFRDGRYRVVRKLSRGAYCTVWLSEDTRDGRAVAIKVCAKSYGAAEQEINIQTYATREPSLANYVVGLLDHFEINAPSGVHACLVFELMWTDLGSLIQRHKDWDSKAKIIVETVKRCIPILQALQDHQIIHNDFRASNLLITFDDQPMTLEKLDLVEKRGPRFTADSKVTAIGEEAETSVIYYPVPLTIVAPGEMVELANMKIKLGDFGSANFIGGPGADPGRLTSLAPEVLLNDEWDARADHWSLGIMILEMFSGQELLSSTDGKKGLLTEMIECFGDMPADMDAKYLSLLSDGESPPKAWSAPLQQELSDYSKSLTGAEIRVLMDFFTSILTLDPADRVGLSELRHHRWLSDERNMERNNPCICGEQVGNCQAIK